MATEIEERIHRALKSHPLERTEQGYRLIHPAGAGVSLLRLLPVKAGSQGAAGPGAGSFAAARGGGVEGAAEGAKPEGVAGATVEGAKPEGETGAKVEVGAKIEAIAEIVAEYHSEGLPPFHAAGVQRLNAMAVHGAYHLRNGRLRQIAQFTIFANEPAAHLAAQTILNAFGGQLPIGLSTALSTKSPAVMEQQRAHHAMPREWQKPPDESQLQAARILFQERGLAASNNASAVWAELPLSGTCPSRSLDPDAETAVMQVNAGIAHPIAGVGYLATISLSLGAALPNAAEICRRLNALELEHWNFAPRLGAWGLHEPENVPGYTCFIPAAEPIDGMHLAIMWWLIARSAWIRDKFWAKGEGLTLERIPRGRLV